MPRITVPFKDRDIDPASERLAQMNALSGLVDDFAREMKKRLFEKLDEGRRGWDDPTWALPIATAMIDSAQDACYCRHDNTEIDTACYAMFLRNLRED